MNSCRLRRTRSEENKTWSVLQEMHTALVALTRYDANDIVANSRKNPFEAWRRLQERYDPTTGGTKTKPSVHDHFSGTVLSSRTPSGS